MVLPVLVPPAMTMLRRSRTACAQGRGLRFGHEAVDDVLRERDDADGALADREGGCAHDGRQDALEALAGLGQLGGDEWARRHAPRAQVRGDEADDALGILRRDCACRSPRSPAPAVEPQRAVGIEHDLDDLGIVERGRDRRPHGGAQHADLAVEQSGAAADGAQVGVMTTSAADCVASRSRRLPRAGASDFLADVAHQAVAALQVPGELLDELLEAQLALRARRVLMRLREPAA